VSINIAFHQPKLIEVQVINNDLTSLDIYDRDEPYGSKLTFFFRNPTELMDWTYSISNKAAEVNKEYMLEKLGVK